jgi:hypothetical protein
MAVLATLKKDRLGEWATLPEYLADLRRRETNSVAALAVLLSAPADEQREIAQGSGLLVLIEIASDLRLPKGSRLAAARCAIEGGASEDALGALFIGAGDLATDPRLGATARKLVESGLPAALARRAGAEVSLEAGAFARAAHASSPRPRADTPAWPRRCSHWGRPSWHPRSASAGRSCCCRSARRTGARPPRRNASGSCRRGPQPFPTRSPRWCRTPRRRRRT